MKLITRKMTSEVMLTDGERQGMNAQASINSDRCLTLRGYSRCRDNDEIMVFSREETEAVFRLFAFLREKNELPF